MVDDHDNEIAHVGTAAFNPKGDGGSKMTDNALIPSMFFKTSQDCFLDYFRF